MHYPALWASLACLLSLSSQAFATHNSHYNRLCPGNNPVRVGSEIYTVSCDKSISSHRVIRKIPHIRNPTPEQCAQVCEQDRTRCVGMIWSSSACYQSLDPNGKQFAHGGGVVLTPLSDSDEKSPAQLQQALAQCDAELAEYKRRFGSIGNGNKPERPAPPRGWPSTLDYTNKGCTPTNHKKTITVYPRLYEIHHNHNLEGSKILGDIVVDNIRDCAVKCADLPGHERCAGASFYILPNHNPKCILYSEMRNIHPAAYARTQTNCMLVEISAYGRR